MKGSYALVLCVLPALSVASVRADEETTRIIDPVLEAFEREAVVVQSEFDEARAALLTATSEKLRQLQDKYAAAAKLDEAVAVRTQIHTLALGWTYEEGEEPKLPDDVRAVVKKHDEALAALDKKRVDRLKEIGTRLAEPLLKRVDELTRESKFDEALIVRDVARRLSGAVTDVEEDPGSVPATPDSIGQIHYYEVVGDDHNSVWGTDVYTCDSYLSTAAVHSGALKSGEQGVVRVTILPGQEKYRASIRNGIESMPYDAYPVSYRVERAYGIFRKSPRRVEGLPDPDPFGGRFVPGANPFGAPR